MAVATLALLNQLCDVASRMSAAQALADRIGVQNLVFFIQDPELTVMLPAPGMPKTLMGGPLWRAFIARCKQPGRISGEVDWPAGTTTQATAISINGVAAVLIGGIIGEQEVAVLEEHMPMLAALLRSEQAMLIGAASAADARGAAARAHALAKALDAARASAAELNQQLRLGQERKDEFLAMLAHELRNPLAPLVNSIEILRRAELDAGSASARQLDVMSRQVRQLTRLVDDLLDISRVSRGAIELRRETMTLNGVLRDAIEASQPAINARAHALQFSGGREDFHVNGDRARLIQIFVNLLHNAAKYTDPGGTLSLSVVPDTGRVSIVVRDNGIGIPPYLLVRIFDVFAQVPAALDRTQGGLGIGLALVRTLVDLHGGHVSAHSVGPGHGSTFTVTLPLVSPSGAVSEPPADTQASVAGEKGVLIVDDNRDAAESLADLLRLMGARVTVAHSGREALEVLTDLNPDLVLLDIGLPGMDGYEVARRMRAMPAVQARLVALTGYGSEQDKQRVHAAGFDDHLVKPVEPAVIAEVLAKAHEGWGAAAR